MLNEQTRNRLIGAVFLVAVAAVLLPMLFDGEGVEPMQLDPLTPADFVVQPDRSPPPDITPALDARRELQAEIDDDGYAMSTGTRFGDPVLLKEPDADARPVNAANAAADDDAEIDPPRKWAVQVASFAQSLNATALRDRLVRDGRTAFLSRVKRDGETVTRVAVGPFVNRDDAAREQREINQRYQVEAAIVHFAY